MTWDDSCEDLIFWAIEAMAKSPAASDLQLEDLAAEVGADSGHVNAVVRGRFLRVARNFNERLQEVLDSKL